MRTRARLLSPTTACLLVSLWLVYDTTRAADNWPQFRGPGALGVSSVPGIPRHGYHVKGSLASETAVTDGERVYAYIGTESHLLRIK